MNQLALIVLLSTAIGRDRHGDLGWLVQGVQGIAHAINEEARYACRVIACWRRFPLTQDDRPLIDEMERTVFSPNWKTPPSARSAYQLKALQGYWHTQLEPGLKQARSTENRCAGRGGVRLTH